MELKVDPRSHLPLHAQVERLLRQLCDRPEHRGGALLPDEVGLAAKLGVSRNTVRAAIERLVQEGLLERRRGVGTRVVRGRAAIHEAPWDGFLGELEPRGDGAVVASALARRERPPEDVAAVLKTGAAELLRLERVLTDGDGPLARIVSWFHPRVAFAADADFRRPLWDLVEQLGIIPTVAHEEVAAAQPDAETTRLLALRRGVPVLERRRVVGDTQGRPLEVATAWYRSGSRRSVEMRRNPRS
jgi:GntR family transcriptional regulator